MSVALPPDPQEPFDVAGPVVSTRQRVTVLGLLALGFVVALVFMVVAWPGVPGLIPLQWELDGTPSTLGPAWTWWLVPTLGLGIGVALVLAAAHQRDRLLRIPLAASGAGVGSFVMAMAAQVVMEYSGAEAESWPLMPNLVPSLGIGAVAGVVAGVLLARPKRA